jgi:hypothetical protein
MSPVVSQIIQPRLIFCILFHDRKIFPIKIAKLISLKYTDSDYGYAASLIIIILFLLNSSCWSRFAGHVAGSVI